MVLLSIFVLGACSTVPQNVAYGPYGLQGGYSELMRTNRTFNMNDPGKSGTGLVNSLVDDLKRRNIL